MFWRKSEPRQPDEIADIRGALADLIKRYLRNIPNKDSRMSLEIRRGTINGVPVGDWRFTVEPIPTPTQEHQQP